MLKPTEKILNEMQYERKYYGINSQRRHENPLALTHPSPFSPFKRRYFSLKHEEETHNALLKSRENENDSSFSTSLSANAFGNEIYNWITPLALFQKPQHSEFSFGFRGSLPRFLDLNELLFNYSTFNDFYLQFNRLNGK